jgi:hypothetical protein
MMLLLRKPLANPTWNRRQHLLATPCKPLRCSAAFMFRLCTHSFYQGYLPASVQNHLPSSVGGQANQPTSESTSGTTSGSSLETAKEYLASAQAAIQPHLEAAASAAQPHIQRAADTAQNYLPASAKPHIEKYLPTTSQTNGTPASSTGIPATSAPLETGQHTVNTTYPPTSTTGSEKIASVDEDAKKSA